MLQTFDRTVAAYCVELCKDFRRYDGIRVRHENIEAVIVVREDLELNGTFVVFRGVDELDDLLQSLDCSYTAVSPGNVHYGFSLALSTILSEIVNYLDDNPVYLTGFSLGGAMAQLSVPILDEMGYEVQCHTFGAPNSFDGSAAIAFDSRYRSHVFNWHTDLDPIVHYPLFGYVPVGTPIEVSPGISTKAESLFAAFARLFANNRWIPLLNFVGTALIGLALLFLRQYHDINVYTNTIGLVEDNDG